tara:strand:- start:68 stop:469 length:402 start_codon:yes stop_codon:yes gene_type:complete
MIEYVPTSLQVSDPLLRRRFVIVAEIKSAQAVPNTAYRWVYTLQVVTIGGDIEVPTFTDLGEEVKAINAREWDNAADSVQGQDPDDLPTNLDYGSVKGYVLCSNGGTFKPDSSSDAEAYLVFAADNPVEGTCA